MSDDTPTVPTPTDSRETWQDSLAGFLLGAEASLIVPEPPVAVDAEVSRPRSKQRTT